MTQDQTGQAQGTGYAREQALNDDETEAGQSGAVTRLKKVASALRGDRPDEPVTDQTVPDGPDQTVPDQRVPAETVPDEMAMTSGDTRVQAQGVGRDAPVDDRADPEYAAGTRPGGIGSGDLGSGDLGSAGAGPADTGEYREAGEAPGVYRDAEEYRETPRDAGEFRETGRAEGAATLDPSRTATGTSDTTDRSGADPLAPAPGDGRLAGTEAGYGEGGTEPAGTGSRGTTAPEYGSPAAASSGYATEAGTVSNDAGNLAGTGTEREDLTSARPGGTTPAEPAVAAGTDVAGTGAAGTDPAAVDATGRPESAEDAGLRPGEATERLGDFGDIAFGNLLPDAAQYSTKWEQIQFRFVDDPQGSVTEAAEVITQVTSKLEEAIQERQRAIQDRQHAIQERASALRGRWGEGSNADTETLRETLRMYKAFMDQLVGPSS